MLPQTPSTPLQTLLKPCARKQNEVRNPRAITAPNNLIPHCGELSSTHGSQISIGLEPASAEPFMRIWGRRAQTHGDAVEPHYWTLAALLAWPCQRASKCDDNESEAGSLRFRQTFLHGYDQASNTTRGDTRLRSVLHSKRPHSS